jgi:hypothetical protein
MVGERMKPANYTEITAVCVHRSSRSRLRARCWQRFARSWREAFRSCTYFSQNESAIAVPAAGMEIRRRLYVTVLRRQM